MDSPHDEPGLQSVPTATGTPASIMARARAYRFRMLNAVTGSSTAITPASAMAFRPASEAARR